MKFLSYFTVIVFLIFASACFDSEKQADTAENEDSESVESAIKKGLYEQVMNIGGESLPEGDIKTWDKTKDVILEIEALETKDSKPLDEQKEALTKIFKRHGFKSYRAGYARIEESSRMINNILSIGLRLASLETIELTKGKKEARQAEKEIIQSLKRDGYTQADVKGLDEHEDIIGKSVGLLLKLPKPE
jgi:hypothetical protein